MAVVTSVPFKPYVRMGDDLKASQSTGTAPIYLPPLDRDQISEFIEATTAAERPIEIGYSTLITDNFFSVI